MKKHFLTLGILSVALILGGASCTKTTTPPAPVTTNTPPTATVNSNANTTQPTTNTTVPTNFLTYNNDAEGVSIDYPSDWTKQDGKNPILVQFFSPLQSSVDQFQENVSVMIQDFSSVGMTLEQFDKQTTDALGQYMTNLKITKQEDMEISGEPGKLLIYTGTMPGQTTPNTTIQAYTVWDDYVYIVTFTGKQGDFEKFVPAVQQMVKSFSF